MKRRKFSLTILMLAIIFSGITGCASKPAAETPVPPAVVEPAPPVTVEPTVPVVYRNNLGYSAAVVINLIKEQDFEKLAGFMDSETGLRFSPYGYVNEKTDLVFTAEQVKGFSKDENVYKWGSFDGSGEPINLSFKEYYSKFIYDKPFAEPDRLGLNESYSKGNTIDNLKEIYPLAQYVEFYFVGTEANANMDWAGLKLVFELKNEEWILVGIVHSQWTI